ncbi:MAG: exodeoxyribonuclease VII small subunit [Lachnospiraceae bacterium]|nr:exodeoxyribonuclease VII small subunit [Lachnospiraceae bacterium]MBP3579386.1 exodeoxyribonuclease VII small subunit [Lachnospiraceae bacterium]
MADKKKTEEPVQELSLEASLDQLEQVMQELSSSELSLEESFTKYKQGMDLLLKCNQAIDKVEKELMILEENGISDEF